MTKEEGELAHSDAGFDPVKFTPHFTGQGLRPFKDWGHCVGLRSESEQRSGN